MTYLSKQPLSHIVTLVLLTAVMLPQSAHAETIAQFIDSKIIGLINPIIASISGLAVVFFLWGVAKFVLNAGNDQKREEGKKVMVWGLIGLFVLFAFWGFVRLLLNSFFTNPDDLDPINVTKVVQIEQQQDHLLII